MFSLPLPFAITKGVDPLFAFVFQQAFHRLFTIGTTIYCVLQFKGGYI